MIAIATAYCACGFNPECPSGTLTAIGKLPVPGITVAAPRSVPFGTRVRITLEDGRRWTLVAQDRTHRRFDGRWDIFMASHSEAVAFGVRKARIEILGASPVGGRRSTAGPPAKPQGYKANGARTQRRAVIPRPHPGNAPASFGTKRK